MTILRFADRTLESPSANGGSWRAVRALRRMRHALSVGLMIGVAGGGHAAEPTRIRLGDPVPACHASDMRSGSQVDLAAHRGRVVYVDFWASWCAPCTKAFPFLNRLDAELGPRGLTVVGISVDERITDAERFLKRFPARFATAHDDKGSCPRAFGVIGMPSSYLIDRHGKIRAVHVGFREGDAAPRTQEIERLLRETEDPGTTEMKR